MIVDDQPVKSPASDSTPLLGDPSGQQADTELPQYTVHPAPIRSQRTKRSLSANRWVIIAVITLILGIVISAELYLNVISRVPRNYEYSFPTDVDLDRCVTAWPRKKKKNDGVAFYPYSVSTSFELPLPSKTLLLLSNGALSNGRLKITESSEITDVQVNVTVKYFSTAVRDSAKVCVIERYKGESGVGIFTPSNWRNVFLSTDRIFFEVELTLPRTGSARYVPGFTTDVDNFSHDVDSLSAHFGDISLTGTNGKIQAKLLSARTATLTSSNAGVIVDSLEAQIATVRTSNGRISGSYTVSDSLHLENSDGPINVAVAVNSTDAKKPKHIVMDTSNGALHCVVNLLVPVLGQAGTFHIRAHTLNAPLQAEIASAPLDSVLTVDAKTSNRVASVALPSTYEGSFEVVTSNAPATFERVYSGERDPACERDEKCSGRSRLVRATAAKRSSVAGTAYWDQKNADRGKVSLTSSNGPATLYL